MKFRLLGCINNIKACLFVLLCCVEMHWHYFHPGWSNHKWTAWSTRVHAWDCNAPPDVQINMRSVLSAECLVILHLLVCSQTATEGKRAQTCYCITLPNVLTGGQVSRQSFTAVVTWSPDALWTNRSIFKKCCILGAFTSVHRVVHLWWNDTGCMLIPGVNRRLESHCGKC